MRKPLLILFSLLLVLVLIPVIGLPMWSSHEKTMSQVPESGIYACEELSMTLTFGWPGILTLPDGTAIETGIDQGRRITNLSSDPTTVEGRYEAHLKDGYVEITFEDLPIPFEPDHPYQFAAISD